MVAAFFWFSTFLLFYVYIGYPAILFIACRSRVNVLHSQTQRFDFLPSVTIIVPAYNEERNIERRIKNLLDCNYPSEKLEIIIASDGSTDRTVEIASRQASSILHVLDFKPNRGRAKVHNDAVQIARGEIIVFTDAGTEFKSDFIRNIVRFFSDPQLGCAVGHLKYYDANTGVSNTEKAYFKIENRIRSMESRLGILPTACGAAMAIRKSIWLPLKPTDDCDFTTPIDAILQGYKNIYISEAIAFDSAAATSAKGELQVRVRMTSKNFIGTLFRFGLKGWFRHPIIGWSLLSHKILRWFSPFFMVFCFFGNALLLPSGALYQVAFFCQVAFYSLCVLGWIGERKNMTIPVAATVFTFCVANLGMGIGVIKGLLGKAPFAYQKAE